MADVFISYSREDETRVQQLVQCLEEQGLSVFWDRRIPAGQTWRSYIGQALSEAGCVIVAWTRHSITSHWVIEEAERGQRRGILVPVLLEAVEPPLGFGNIQAGDLTDWLPGHFSQQVEQLVQDIKVILGTTPSPPREGQQLVLPKDVRTDYNRTFMGSRAVSEFTFAERHSVIYRRTEILLLHVIRLYVDDGLIAKRWIVPTEEWEQYFEIEGHGCQIRCKCYLFKMDVRVMVGGFQVLHV